MQTAAGAAYQNNTTSMSNGSLMRCTPLAVWGCLLKPSSLARAVVMDVALTHPSQDVQSAVATYVIACSVLIRTGDRAEALAVADRWCNDHATPLVQEWMADSHGALQPHDTFGHQMGFIKHG